MLRASKKNYVNEGGAVGHLQHIVDNRELTFAEIKNILSIASKGKLQKVSEKFDGMNLVFSWDSSTNALRAARNTTDIKNGGLDADGIAAKFRDRGNVGDAFNSAFKVLNDALGAIPESTLINIFGENCEKWYSMEVIYTQNPNVINYDENSIIFHGWPVFQVVNGKVQKSDDESGVDIISANVEKMQKAVTMRSWRVRGPSLLKMKEISDGTVLRKAINKIEAAQGEAGVSDSQTIEDYLRSLVTDVVIQKFGLPKEITSAIVERVIESSSAPKLTAIKMLLKNSQLYEEIAAFVKESPKLLKDLIFPIEDAIYDLSIEVLHGLESSLINDSSAEVQRLRAEVKRAINAIESSGQEDAIAILQAQMQKLKSIEGINTPMEGIVFMYKGNAYKFTGSFAAANQILGLFKYGRGSIKPMATTESVRIKPWYAYLQHDSAKEANSRQARG